MRPSTAPRVIGWYFGFACSTSTCRAPARTRCPSSSPHRAGAPCAHGRPSSSRPRPPARHRARRRGRPAAASASRSPRSSSSSRSIAIVQRLEPCRRCDYGQCAQVDDPIHRRTPTFSPRTSHGRSSTHRAECSPRAAPANTTPSLRPRRRRSCGSRSTPSPVRCRSSPERRRAARSRDPGRTSGRRRRCGRLARAAALSGGRHAGRAHRVRRGDRRGIRSSRR